MTQAAEAMKLAAETGITLKEAWAQVKGESGETEDASNAGEHTLKMLKNAEEAF